MEKLSTSFRVNAEIIKNNKFDSQELVKYNMAKGIAQELMKGEKLVITELRPEDRDTHFPPDESVFSTEIYFMKPREYNAIMELLHEIHMNSNPKEKHKVRTIANFMRGNSEI